MVVVSILEDLPVKRVVGHLDPGFLQPGIFIA